MFLQIINAKDFRIAKFIKEHLKEIQEEILNKVFIELSESDKVMKILYDYDKSACIDEKMKEDALRKYVKIWWINADVEILKKFLERVIQNQELIQDIMTLLIGKS
ncbi:MAG: hypothetical protein QMD06_03715 [Candidatus Altarchaeum sp.]|nr:hypothetical protein [Candidatus Altarchaeum sp.]